MNQKANSYFLSSNEMFRYAYTLPLNMTIKKQTSLFAKQTFILHKEGDPSLTLEDDIFYAHLLLQRNIYFFVGSGE